MKLNRNRTGAIKKRWWKSQSGFTLPEMIIVIAIIAVLSGVLFLNYRKGQRQLALERSTSKLAQDIRRAEGMATSSQSAAGCSIMTYRYGHGITLIQSSATYTLFADCNNNSGRDSADVVVESDQLEENVTIAGFSFVTSLGERTAPAFDIAFNPPDPIVTFNAPGLDPTDISVASIILQNVDGMQKTITINKAGLVDIH